MTSRQSRIMVMKQLVTKEMFAFEHIFVTTCEICKEKFAQGFNGNRLRGWGHVPVGTACQPCYLASVIKDLTLTKERLRELEDGSKLPNPLGIGTLE